MKQKVIKIGTSIGVVLPKPLAEEMGLKAGQEVNVLREERGVIIEPRVLKPDANPELVAWADDAVERYRPALEALKDK